MLSFTPKRQATKLKSVKTKKKATLPRVPNDLQKHAATLRKWERRLAPLMREIVRSGRVMSLIEAARITCDAAGEFELRYHPGDRPKARRALLKAERLITRALAHLDKLQD